MSQITVKVSLVGARGLNRAAMHRLRACAVEVDRCHVGPGALVGYKNEYRLIYRPRKGFAWVEVYYGHGMCGWHKSLRAAVTRAAQMGMVVHLDEVWQPARAPISSPIYVRDCLAVWGVVPDFCTAPAGSVNSARPAAAAVNTSETESAYGSQAGSGHGSDCGDVVAPAVSISAGVGIPAVGVRQGEKQHGSGREAAPVTGTEWLGMQLTEAEAELVSQMPAVSEFLGQRKEVGPAMVQRVFRCGYNRASAILALAERAGWVGEPSDYGRREVRQGRAA